MAWMNNFKTWTGLSREESIRMTEDRDKWRKYVHGQTGPRCCEQQLTPSCCTASPWLLIEPTISWLDAFAPPRHTLIRLLANSLLHMFLFILL